MTTHQSPHVSCWKLLALGTGLCQWASAQTVDYVTPASVPAPSEPAARQTLEQSTKDSPLRFAGLDFYPHATGTVLYDDNVLITSNSPLRDVEWTLAPGLMVAAGDVSATMSGVVTFAELRSLVHHSLVENDSKPQRFLAVDYTPAINFFTDHSDLNNVDHYERLSGGYGLGLLSLWLDQDFTHAEVKSSAIGTRLGTTVNDVALRALYEVTDRTSLEASAQYYQQDYDQGFEGYQEFRNEAWLNRQPGEKLSLSLGGAFGYVWPQSSANQTYEQLLGRATYRLTDKLDVRAAGGLEWRQYDNAASDTLHPVFSLGAIYQLRDSTTLSLEGHRLDEPSPFAGLNYTFLGFTAAVRQRLWNRLYLAVAGGYDHVDYRAIQPGETTNRADDYFSVQVNLDYELNPHWGAGVFYVHRENDSNEATFTYANNLVGARLTWNF